MRVPLPLPLPLIRHGEIYDDPNELKDTIWHIIDDAKVIKPEREKVKLKKSDG